MLTIKAAITIAAGDTFFTSFPVLEKIRYDISCELSDCRRFSKNIMPYLLFLKKQQHLKFPSAANYMWRFMSENCG